MFEESAEKLSARISAAGSVDLVVAHIQAYVARLQGSRRLPASCRLIEINNPADIFNWWLEFDRLTAESRDGEPVLAECRDVFGTAWEKAASLGYRLKPNLKVIRPPTA